MYETVCVKCIEHNDCNVLYTKIGLLLLLLEAVLVFHLLALVTYYLLFLSFDTKFHIQTQWGRLIHVCKNHVKVSLGLKMVSLL